MTFALISISKLLITQAYDNIFEYYMARKFPAVLLPIEQWEVAGNRVYDS